MRIFLDEQPCDINASSVGQAIAAASAIVEQRGRMIVDVVVDGRQLESTDLDSIQHNSSASEVRLQTADPIELVCETFKDASRALTDANQLQVSAAELIQSNQTAAAMSKLNDAFSIWTSVQQAVTMGMQLTGMEPVAGRDEQNINATIDKLNEQLRGIRSALECKDTVALADTLLYDLPDVVCQWQDLLEDLDAHVRSQGSDHQLQEDS